MKKFFLGSLMSLFALVSQAQIVQTFTFHQVATNVASLITNGTRIESISITTPTASGINTVYRFQDMPPIDTSLGFYAAGHSNAYRTVQSYLTNFTRYVTNFGWTTATYSNVYTGVKYTYTNSLATTNTWRAISAGTAASNAATTTIEFDPPYHAIWGIAMTNNATPGSGNGTIIITHTPDL